MRSVLPLGNRRREPFFCSSPNLTYLDVDYAFGTANEMASVDFIAGLEELRSLRALDLRGNTPLSVLRALPAACPLLEHLGFTHTDHTLELLKVAIGLAPTLRSLCFALSEPITPASCGRRPRR